MLLCVVCVYCRSLLVFVVYVVCVKCCCFRLFCCVLLCLRAFGFVSFVCVVFCFVCVRLVLCRVVFVVFCFVCVYFLVYDMNTLLTKQRASPSAVSLLLEMLLGGIISNNWVLPCCTP